jgi:hypothetical protein
MIVVRVGGRLGKEGECVGISRGVGLLGVFLLERSLVCMRGTRRPSGCGEDGITS